MGAAVLSRLCCEGRANAQALKLLGLIRSGLAGDFKHAIAGLQPRKVVGRKASDRVTNLTADIHIHRLTIAPVRVI